MALTGLDIYKLLPKTNCKECGFPTCLAFAMKLAQKGTELNKCPYVSEASQGRPGRRLRAAHPPGDRGRGRRARSRWATRSSSSATRRPSTTSPGW